jgi:hypothetical protein
VILSPFKKKCAYICFFLLFFNFLLPLRRGYLYVFLGFFFLKFPFKVKVYGVDCNVKIINM